MNYSYDQDREGVVFANIKDVNASFKDLGAVCTAIRYKTVPVAVATLEATINEGMPIPYVRHNINMGARHELGGKKGRYPIRCAKIVQKVLINAMANAKNKGMNPEHMYVIHASANKTIIARRGPSVGPSSITGGPSGYSGGRAMDLEFARVELGLSEMNEKKMKHSMVTHIKYTMSKVPKVMVRKAQAAYALPKKVEKKKEKGKDHDHDHKGEKKPLIALEKKESPKEKYEDKKGELKTEQKVPQ